MNTINQWTRVLFLVVFLTILAMLSGCPTPTNSEPGTFTAVKDITGIPAAVAVNGEIDLNNAEVIPENATNKRINWNLKDAAGETIAIPESGKFARGIPGTLKLTAVIINGLAEGTDYEKTFTIIIDTAEEAPVTPGDPPLISTDNERIKADWTAVTGANAYEVWYGTSSDSAAAVKWDDTPDTDTSAVITGLTNGTRYYVWIKAKNSKGSSGFSPVADGTPVEPVTAPADPEAPSLTADNAWLEVSWTAVTGANAYEVWYGTSSDSTTAVKWDDTPDTDTSAVITGLTNGTRYYVWIKAKNSGGTSGFSPSATGTPSPGYLTESISIDGEKDAAWDSNVAVKASGGMVTPSGNDLAALYVANDTDNLYVALELKLSDFWANDRLVLIIDKAGKTSGYSDSSSMDASWQKAADTMTFTDGEADIYFFHNPGQTGTGASVLHVDGSVLEADWAGNPTKVSASSYHWDNPDYPPFLEYRFALNDLGIVKDDVIRVFAVVSNYWVDTTIHATDIVPEIGPPDNQDVTFSFNSALSYTITGP